MAARKEKSFSNKTPRQLGFRMPAEWEPHAATWIAWPHNPEDWPRRFAPIPWVYADIVRHLAAGEDVRILVNDAQHEAKARKTLQDAGVETVRVFFHRQPTDRVWTRDSGAIFVTNGKELGACEWKFNAWAKYPDWRKDVKVAGRMVKEAKARSWQPEVELGAKRKRVVLEGGSIDVNGRGLLLTTEECLLSEVQVRNPGMSREEYEQVFAEYLGIEKVIWLKRGIVGDDTHGHVDDLARFVDAQTIVLAAEPDREDENHDILQENLELLRNTTDQTGGRLKVVMLPMPRPVVICGQRVPASYANFYVANRRVLVPTFNDPNDRVAMNTLAELFPGREVVGIHCGDFIWGLGAIHCMTQQQPSTG